MTRSWDIFCSVVDNYGDIGVCWRLARQLVTEGAQEVRLWIDNLPRLHQLCRAVDSVRESQRVEGVEIVRWNSAANTLFPQVRPAEIVIEGFGVHLPATFVAAMAARKIPPVWINLEYLSAETWVDAHHGLPSAQPKLPLTKYFFFPGFTAATGGLLIERNLIAKRDAFQSDAQLQANFLRHLGIRVPERSKNTRRLSLFCYDNAALPSLVAAWAASPDAIVCFVPEGQALAQIASILGREFSAGAQLAHGSLLVSAIPFLEQDDYDRLLWLCDVNFVRGEDSFVRAQLASRPFIWQAYPQADETHLVKMRAFLERYATNMESDLAQPLGAMFDAFNRQGIDAGPCWVAFSRRLGSLDRYAQDWAVRLVQGNHLAESLAQFCEIKLK